MIKRGWIDGLVLGAGVLVLTLVGAVNVVAQPPQPSDEPPAAKGWRAVTVADGIAHPWGMAWLPDGTLLVTAKEGTLHVLDGKRFSRIPLQGLPPVFTGGQGGLLDIAVHPKDSRRLYFTMSTGTKDANRTILVRGVFDGKQVTNVETLFQVEPTKSDGQHFGSRLLFLPDGTLLMSIGDGGNPPQRVGDRLAREQAQNLGTHHGSMLRLTDDGKPAKDNPFANTSGARPEIWSYGHRNIQGLTRDPQSDRIWATEHGPFGGDELNLLERGKNYGWPRATLGRDYRTKEPIGQKSVAGMVDPRVVWIPRHAPSGLAFYTGDKYSDWRGSLFSGGLAAEDVRRIVLDSSGKVTGQERLAIGARVRDVRQGPDGYLYVLTDEKNGRLLRIERTP
jgi:glucose/arabinose dehydrogenase